MELLKTVGCLMVGIGLGYGCSAKSKKIFTFGWLLAAAGFFLLHFLGVRWQNYNSLLISGAAYHMLCAVAPVTFIEFAGVLIFLWTWN